MTTDLRRRGDPGTPDFEVELYPFYLLNRLVSRYNPIIEAALKPLGADIPTWRVLMILGEEAPRSMTQISERAVINLSTMTRIVQRMVEAGLVRCAPRPDDNRVTEVYLTAAGETALAAIRRATAPIYAHVIGGLSEDEFALLIDLLKRLYRNLASIPRP